MPNHESYLVQLPISDFPENAVVYRYVDDDFCFMDLNKNAEAVEVHSKEKLIGRRLADVYPDIKASVFYGLMLKVQEEGILQEFDCDFLHGSGQHYSVQKLNNGDLLVLSKDVRDYRRLEMEIQENKKALDEAQHIARIGDWKWDMVTNEVTWSDEVYRIFGEQPQSFEPTFERFMSYLPDEDKATLHEVVTRAIENDEPYNVGHHIMRRDEKYCYVNGSGHALFNAENTPVAMIGKVFDITERRKEMQQHKETAAELKLLGQAIEQTDEMIRITDKDGVITYVNDALVAHTGYRKVELLGQNMSIFKSDLQDPGFYQELWKTISSGKTYRGIMINKKRDQSIYHEEQTITPIFDDAREIRHYVSTSQDITERIAMERQLKLLATTDGLTGISNRRKISEEIEMQRVRSNRYEEPFTLVMFDFDLFKEVNDTFGHEVGDYVLIKTCALVSKSIREGDGFGRWGGEEFMLIFPGLDAEKAMRTAEKLRDLVASFSFKDVSDVTISLGVSTYSKNESTKALLKRVDDALYEAKGRGRNMVVFK